MLKKMSGIGKVGVQDRTAGHSLFFNLLDKHCKILAFLIINLK
jgi:hypothetical protein